MLQSLRNKLADILKSVDVYKIDDFELERPETHTLTHSVETHSMTPEVPRPETHHMELTGRITCKAQSFEFKNRVLKAKSYLVRRYVKSDVKSKTREMKSRVPTRDMLRHIQALPLELEDRLKFQKARPKLLRNEMLLAWYGPIVEGAVIKLVWNKQRGTLLVWYNPRSRQFKARGVYLIRRLGLGEKPEWRWV